MTIRWKLICKWCGNEFVPPSNRGRKPDYCSQSHRQRAYEARNFVRKDKL